MNCLAQAVAELLGLTLEEVFTAVGHRGDKILHPQLPEPLCRVGFHFDEFQELCIATKSSILVYFPRYPVSAVLYEEETYTHAITSKFYPKAIALWTGIYIGETEDGIPHAQYVLSKLNRLSTIDAYLALVPI